MRATCGGSVKSSTGIFMGLLVVLCVSAEAAWELEQGTHQYPRYSSCLAAVKGRLVLIGGKIRLGEEKKPVEVWNPESGVWEVRGHAPFEEIHRTS